ncbi:MAG: SdpI family protein [Lachnospiraceae bacterium]
MKPNKVLQLITLVIAIIPIFYYAFIQGSLPDQIPMHFDFQGNVNRYGDKSELLFLALLPLGMFFLFMILPKIDPKGKSYEKVRGFYDIFMLFMTLFMDAILFIVIRVALNPGSVNISLFSLLSIGALFILIGNYMPRFKQNYTMGIKTPWTLNSEIVWIKTHRMGGYAFTISGVLFVFAAFTDGIFLTILMSLCFIIILVPCVASYFYYQAEQKRL